MVGSRYICEDNVWWCACIFPLLPLGAQSCSQSYLPTIIDPPTSSPLLLTIVTILVSSSYGALVWMSGFCANWDFLKTSLGSDKGLINNICSVIVKCQALNPDNPGCESLVFNLIGV